MQTGITEGAVERDDNGKMVAFLRTHGPSQSLQELNERLGLASFEMFSEDGNISVDPENPTTFSYDNTVMLPKGEKVLDMNTWQPFMMPMNINCHVVATAKGVLHGNVFAGVFITEMNYLEARMAVQMSGTFEIYLA